MNPVNDGLPSVANRTIGPPDGPTFPTGGITPAHR